MRIVMMWHSCSAPGETWALTITLSRYLDSIWGRLTSGKWILVQTACRSWSHPASSSCFEQRFPSFLVTALVLRHSASNHGDDGRNLDAAVHVCQATRGSFLRSIRTSLSRPMAVRRWNAISRGLWLTVRNRIISINDAGLLRQLGV